MEKSIAITMCALIIISNILYGQEKDIPTHQDSLRGTLNKERNWWNVIKYDVAVQPDYPTKTIKGKTSIHFAVLKPGQVMQIDLQQPLQIDSIVWQGQILTASREGNVFHVSFPHVVPVGESEIISITYSGKPREAIRPPWDGGWIWAKDKKGRPWMSVACQGLGASVWYPCKDHQSDEPDQGAVIAVTVPDTLVAVANGRLKEVKAWVNGLTTYTWTVTNPINNYNIIPYIGKYVNWHETFAGEKGDLDCDYWVLDYELEVAKKQFQQVPKMLKCFEYWFGPYPFYEDSYKLVQSPHLGMEHQSAVAYGNQFQNGYLGRDLSQTGWGLKWDFIIVHESGHEWFGNNITSNDIADMWLHEGFTNYSETLFTTCEFGVEAGNDYVIGTRKLISNDTPIIGPYGVNQEGSSDMYYKGGNLLHTVRQIINNDEKFRKIMRGLNEKFRHQTVTTQTIENYISQESGINFSKVFDQYLRTTQIPVLEYKVLGSKLSYRWNNCVEGYDMPIRLANKEKQWTRPAKEWKKLKGVWTSTQKFLVDRNFYVELKNVQ